MWIVTEDLTQWLFWLQQNHTYIKYFSLKTMFQLLNENKNLFYFIVLRLIEEKLGAFLSTGTEQRFKIVILTKLGFVF